eukprot:TRINITY_DN48461_c0_g1_i1.p1 TRINITY_DN48461_c0_g1~~TRINITY_DN48461_c0_g1_i1.p1  ORF type:complete len:163 (-),score=25.41 TRINITY_DN48461_c0_g1_i1:192-680(-)
MASAWAARSLVTDLASRPGVLVQLRRFSVPKTRPITDIGSDTTKPVETGPVDAEAIRALVRHPRLSSLQISGGTRTATLRHQQVNVNLPLSEFRERIRKFGWEAQNCHQPVLLFGDDDEEVERAHAVLLEEGFTAVSNARSREAVVAALKKTPAHLRSEPNE